MLIPFERLDIFATNFIIQNMRDLIGRNLFTRRPLVNTTLSLRNIDADRECIDLPNHGDTDRPRRIAD